MPQMALPSCNKANAYHKGLAAAQLSKDAGSWAVRILAQLIRYHGADMWPRWRISSSSRTKLVRPGLQMSQMTSASLYQAKSSQKRAPNKGRSICPDFHNLDPCSSAHVDIGVISSLLAVLVTDGLASAQKKKSVPLTEFLRPDNNIKSWADEEMEEGKHVAALHGCTALKGLHLHSCVNAAWQLRWAANSLPCFGRTQAQQMASSRWQCAFLLCALGTKPPWPDVGPLPTAPGQGSSSVGSPTTRSSGAAAFGRELPDAPPYKVYMGNVSYDLTDAAVRDLFRDSRIQDIHILKHHDSQKPKGAFVEFSTKEELADALTRNGENFLGRPVRIDIAEARPERGRGGFGGSRSGGGGFADSYGRDRGGASGGESRRGGGFSDRGGFGDRYGEPRGFGGDRDRGFSDRGYGDRDRGFSDRGPRGGGGGFPPREYEGDSRGSRGGYSSRGGHEEGRPEERRGFGSGFDRERRSHDEKLPRHDYAGFAGGRENGGGRWAHAESGSLASAPRAATELSTAGSAKTSDAGDAPAAEPSAAARPKLTLQPKQSGELEGPAKPKANPFGSAKPVDTSSKLKEFEERIAKEKVQASGCAGVLLPEQGAADQLSRVCCKALVLLCMLGTGACCSPHLLLHAAWQPGSLLRSVAAAPSTKIHGQIRSCGAAMIGDSPTQMRGKAWQGALLAEKRHQEQLEQRNSSRELSQELPSLPAAAQAGPQQQAPPSAKVQVEQRQAKAQPLPSAGSPSPNSPARASQDPRSPLQFGTTQAPLPGPPQGASQPPVQPTGLSPQAGAHQADVGLGPAAEGVRPQQQVSPPPQPQQQGPRPHLQFGQHQEVADTLGAREVAPPGLQAGRQRQPSLPQASQPQQQRQEGPPQQRPHAGRQQRGLPGPVQDRQASGPEQLQQRQLPLRVACKACIGPTCRLKGGLLFIVQGQRQLPRAGAGGCSRALLRTVVWHPWGPAVLAAGAEGVATGAEHEPRQPGGQEEGWATPPGIPVHGVEESPSGADGWETGRPQKARARGKGRSQGSQRQQTTSEPAAPAPASSATSVQPTQRPQQMAAPPGLQQPGPKPEVTNTNRFDLLNAEA
eukprot:jgi/Astpho2/1435/fgenesh1_pg.00025_%23_42_t